MEVVFNPLYKESIEKRVEIWVSLAELGFPSYELSSFNKIRNRDSGKFQKPQVDADGYPVARLLVGEVGGKRKKRTKRMHFLLGTIFITKPVCEKPLSIDHIDRNRLNNDLFNLRWATASQQNSNRTKVESTQLAINQYDADGVFLRRWSSTKEITASNPDLTKIVIQRITGGFSAKTEQGYLFEYEKSDLPGEEWKKHPDLGTLISNKGRVKKKNGVPTIGSLSIRGHYYVSIGGKQCVVARLVAETFMGLRPNNSVKHINGDKKDSCVENLAFIPTKNYIRPNLKAKLYKKPSVRILQIDTSTDEIICIYESVKEACSILGLHYCNINTVCNHHKTKTGIEQTTGGFKWRFITEPAYAEKVVAFENSKKRKADNNDERCVKRVKMNK